MSYIEGFVTAVPTANRDEYVAHATKAAELLRGFGATRMVESWGEGVTRGKNTDFFTAVQATDDETPVLSWFEYPDKATRDAANAKMMAAPGMEELAKDMPFDGRRMIYGGFENVLDTGGGSARPGYVDGFVAAVPADKRDEFLRHARFTADLFVEKGAIRVVDGWGDDISDGQVTDYKRAVQARDGETIVYGWLEWPDQATRDAAMAGMMEDSRMRDNPPPWNGQLAIFGGFTPIIDITLD